jgi:hypothetical protein
VRARVPLDIDLEDRLVYGLTPMRLAYAVLGGLGAMAVWSLHDLFTPLRTLAAVAVAAAGGTLAWGRISGRPADAWIVDFALFVTSTRRLSWRQRDRG